MYNYNTTTRRKSRVINVGDVLVGGDNPIAVQTMTNTLTTDVQATIKQIHKAEEAGVDIIRVSVPDADSSVALRDIIANVNVPVVADIHYHYKRGIESAKAGAACLRINPGNIGSKDRVREVIKVAKDYGCSIRIGVNAGSLEKHLLEKYHDPCPEAMVASAMYHANLLYDADFHNFKISVKASDIYLAVKAYEQLAKIDDTPLHLGITEAGSLGFGTIKSSIGLGMLLYGGIGDTIRVSLSADPIAEVKVGFDILKALNLRHRGVQIISCPSCARQQFNVIETVRQVEERVSHITKPITVSIIGCIVNGIGEAKMSDIGFTGGGNNTHMLYIDGKPFQRYQGEDLVNYLVDKIEEAAGE